MFSEYNYDQKFKPSELPTVVCSMFKETQPLRSVQVSSNQSSTLNLGQRLSLMAYSHCTGLGTGQGPGLGWVQQWLPVPVPFPV